jgi:uncharacterized protein YbjT (DUF2867 family)
MSGLLSPTPKTNHLMNTNVAIIGSTGQSASAWTDAFVAAGYAVRGLVRHPRLLPNRPGIRYRRFDLYDPSTYQPALEEIDTLALVTPADPRQPEWEIGLINAARNTSVRRIIKLSVIGADFIFPLSPFARWHAEIEDALRTSGITHVILRPNFFMQNLLMQKEVIESGIYMEPIGTASISFVNVRDIADIAVIAASGALDDQALTLTGPEKLSGDEVAALLSKATGTAIHFVSPDISEFRATLLSRGMPEWHVAALAELYSLVQKRHGAYLGSTTSSIEEVTGQSPRTLEEFVNSAFRLRRSGRDSFDWQVARRFFHQFLGDRLDRDARWPVGFKL